MNEKILLEKFYNFLESEKGFPKKSLLKHAPVYAINGNSIQVDLLLLDTRIGEYIGIVEFKININPQVKKNIKNKIELYQKALKTDYLPFYLVFPNDQGDFQILVYGDDDWIPISKDEFPEFETLSAKKKIEEKNIAKEIERENIKYYERKRYYKRITSLWTLTSLITGILSIILLFYTDHKKKLKQTNIYKYDLISDINKLEHKLKKIESQTLKLETTSDTIFIIDSTKTYYGLNKRLESIENGIVNNAEKTLAVKNIQQQIELLKEQIKYQDNIFELRNQNIINRIEWLNAIVIGMVVALFTAAIGFVISNYNERKHNR